MATQLPYEARDSSNELKGKEKARSFEVLDRLEELPVLGTVYKKSASAYDATKNFNGLTRVGFEVVEAPVKVVATHIDDKFGEQLHRADEYVCAQMDRAGDVVRPKLERLSSDIRRGPEGILDASERFVDTVLPPLHGHKSRFLNPPKSNVRRALVLGVTIADRLFSRFIFFVQAFFAVIFLTITSFPEKIKSKVDSYIETVQNVALFFLTKIFQLLPFLNPFYTYRFVKSYSQDLVSKYTERSPNKKKHADKESGARVAEEVVSSIGQNPKGEAPKKRGKRTQDHS